MYPAWQLPMIQNIYIYTYINIYIYPSAVQKWYQYVPVQCQWQQHQDWHCALLRSCRAFLRGKARSWCRTLWRHEERQTPDNMGNWRQVGEEGCNMFNGILGSGGSGNKCVDRSDPSDPQPLCGPWTTAPKKTTAAWTIALYLLGHFHAVVVYCSGSQWDFAGIHNTSSVPISKVDFDDYLLKGLQGFPPQLIKVLVQGSELHRGTSINWLVGTNHPPGHNKWCSSRPPRLIFGKINNSRVRELQCFLCTGGPQIISSN